MTLVSQSTALTKVRRRLKREQSPRRPEGTDSLGRIQESFSGQSAARHSEEGFRALELAGVGEAGPCRAAGRALPAQSAVVTPGPSPDTPQWLVPRIRESNKWK